MISEKRVKELEELVRDDPEHQGLVKERLKLWCFVDINNDTFKDMSVEGYYKHLGFTEVKVIKYKFLKTNERAVYVRGFEYV